MNNKSVIHFYHPHINEKGSRPCGALLFLLYISYKEVIQMEELLAVLEQIIEKYQIEPQDVAAIQEAIDAAQGMSSDEFTYDEPVEQ